MNFFGGPCQQRVEGAGNAVFLTFDDGPDPASTASLLDFCAREKLKASFFLVAERAEAAPLLAQRIGAEGHAIGNHSLDHRYHHFFRGSRHLERWISQAQESLTRSSGRVPLAFRSPAGVRTPELKRALKTLGLPLVHWNMRFFDAIFPWSHDLARRAAVRAEAGDILLLHDQARRQQRSFHEALGSLVRALRERGLEPAALEPRHLLNVRKLWPD